MEGGGLVLWKILCVQVVRRVSPGLQSPRRQVASMPHGSSSDLRGSERDGIAELLQTADVVTFETGGVELVEVVGT